MILDSSIYDGIEELGLTTDLQGWHSDHPVFKRLIDEVKPKIIVEIGSWKGASAIHMARLAREAKIYCADMWAGGVDHCLSNLPQDHIPRLHGYPQLYFQFLHNVKACGVHHQIIPVPQSSLNAIRILYAKGIQPDLIYVDGSHEEDDVMLDVSYCKWLGSKTQAVIFGDDWRWGNLARGVISGNGGKPPREIVDGNFWIL